MHLLRRRLPVDSLLVVSSRPIVHTTLGVILNTLGSTHGQAIFRAVVRTTSKVRNLRVVHRRTPALIILSLGVPKLDKLSFLDHLRHRQVSAQTIIFATGRPQFCVRHYAQTKTVNFIRGAGSLRRLYGTIRTLLDNCACFPQLRADAIGLDDIRVSRRRVVSALSSHRLDVFRMLTRNVAGRRVTRHLRLDRGAIDACGAQLVVGLGIRSLIRLESFTGHGRLV